MPVEKPRLRFVFAAQIGDQKIERQRADGQVKAAQRAATAGRRRRPTARRPAAAAGSVTKNGRIELLEQDADGEGAGRQQAGVAKRDLARIPGQQHQGQRADHGEKNLGCEIEQEGRGHKRQGEQDHEHAEAGQALEPRLATGASPRHSRCGNSRWRAVA